LEIFLCEQLQLQIQNQLCEKLANVGMPKIIQENEEVDIELTLSAPDESSFVPVAYQQALLRGFCLDLIYIYNCDNSLIGDVKIISALNLYISLKGKDKLVESIIILDHSLSWFFAYLTKFSAPFFVFEHSYSALLEALAQCGKEISVLMLMNIISVPLFENLLALWQSFLSVKDTSTETLREWWGDNAEVLANQLLETLREERNICHDWELPEESVELLKRYYVANRLLIDCITDLPPTETSLAENLIREFLLLNSDCLISEEISS
jgi:hypothetical protein